MTAYKMPQLEEQRSEIQDKINRYLAKLAKEYPEVTISITGTLSKINPAFSNLQIMVYKKSARGLVVY